MKLKITNEKIDKCYLYTVHLPNGETYRYDISFLIGCWFKFYADEIHNKMGC